MRIDHVVLWVEDPMRSLAFYTETLGLEGVRIDAFKAGKAPFPSVRLAADQIIDLMPLKAVPMIEKIPGAAGTAGHRVNHVCLAMEKPEYDALRARIEATGGLSMVMKDFFGARGQAPEAFYFKDPDGNVLEARYY